MRALLLPPEARARIEREACAAFPRECCGLLVGNGPRVIAVHPVRNIATGRDRFMIDPAAHARLQREARVRGECVIGCYHSHPNGRAQPSARDREQAAEDGFFWLIAATGHGGAALAGFVFEKDRFEPVELREAALA